MSAPPLWLRSLRSRPSIAVLLFALSATAVLTSALGPLLVQAVHQSSLADALAAAGPTRTSVAASLDLERGDDLDRAGDEIDGVFAGIDRNPATSLWQALLGVLIGLAGGVAAVTLGASRLPLVDVYAPGAPLDLHLAWPPLLRLGVGATLVTLAVAGIGARFETGPQGRDTRGEG